jgi:competence protein ComEC
MRILQFPLVRITLWFVLGILFAFYVNLVPRTAFMMLFGSACLFAIAYFFTTKELVQKIYFGITTFLLSFCIGTITQVAHNEYYQENNYIHKISNTNSEYEIEVVLREKIKGSKWNDRFIALVKKIDGKQSNGRILLTIPKSLSNTKLLIGSNLQIKGTVLKHKTITNPNQFDYGRYLSNKSIFAQIYANPDEIKISPSVDQNIWHYADVLRTKIIRNLEINHFNKEELHVIAALILGQQQDIEPEILHDYQFAGAIHILSVSGLHVGFILLFITFILKPLPKNKIGNTLRLVSIILTLWSFALIAGLSPSVVRSVTMFSFVALGLYLKRNTSIFHTLLVSILFILLFQPSFLFDIGFQLSYIALFFILWLQPLLSKLWQPKNKILIYFWDILTVSFAAQIGAFPLSIYYFHQFPGLFFITNLIVIPFLSVIMALGVFVMLLAAFNYVPQLPARLLEWSIYVLNQIIGKIASFEQFIIKDIACNESLLLSLYLFIIALILLSKKTEFKTLTFALIALILFQTTYFSSNWTSQNQKEWIVFNNRKKPLIIERVGQHTTVFAEDSIQKEISKNTMLQSYLVGNFSTVSRFEKPRNLHYFKNKKILIIDQFALTIKNANPDILVLTQSPKLNLERLLQNYKPEMIVADASNYKTYTKAWKTTCRKMKIPFHAVAEKGFYRLK